MNSGIYTITNLVNGKIYVGCTKDFTSREYTHFNLLKKNKHFNHHLQKAFNKYKQENLVFEILEICDNKYLYSQENYWINMLNTLNMNYGYNLSMPNPDKKGNHSLETKLKISASHSKNPSRPSRKLTDFEIEDICKELVSGARFSQLKQKYNQLTGHILSDIRNKNTFKYITDNFDFPKVKKSSEKRKLSSLLTPDEVTQQRIEIRRINGNNKSELYKKEEKVLTEKQIKRQLTLCKYSFLQKDLEGNIIYLFLTSKELEEAGFQQCHMKKCSNNDKYTHRGYKWEVIPFERELTLNKYKTEQDERNIVNNAVDSLDDADADINN